MTSYMSYLLASDVMTRTQRLPSRDVLAQAFPAFKVFTHAQLITRLYVAGKAWVPRLGAGYYSMQVYTLLTTPLTLPIAKPVDGNATPIVAQILHSLCSLTDTVCVRTLHWTTWRRCRGSWGC